MEKELIKKLHDDNTNKIVIGNTYSGKTGNVLFPFVDYMIEKKENILIIDSKEEYYKTYIDELEKLDYEVIVLNFRDASRSSMWNPLEYPYDLYLKGKKDLAIELITKIGKILFNDDSSSDPFWSNSANDFFTGIVLGLFEDAKREEINLSSVFAILNSDKKIKDYYLINKYFNLKDKNEPAYLSASGTVFAPKETRASILSVAKQKLKPYVLRYSLTNMLSKNSIDFDKLINKRTAIFIITKDESLDVNLLAPIFINNLFTLILENKSKLGYNFILDNFETLVNVDGLTEMLSSSTYRNIDFYIGCRNYEEFVNSYGKKIENILTKIVMESTGVKIEAHGNSTKAIKGRNLLRKDICFEEANYPFTDINDYLIFDLEKFVNNNFILQIDKQIENITKSVDEGIDKTMKKVNEISNQIGIDDMIAKIDKKIEELSRGKLE